MKFAVALAYIFLSISTLVSAARVRAVTPRSGCEGSQVTGNTTVSHDGGEIGVVTGACPQSSKAKRSESTLEERQYYLCTEGTCYVTCEDLTYYTIYPSDCEYVISYLNSYYDYTVTIPAYGYQEWYYGSCGVYFWNNDYYDYDVCYSEIAYDAAMLNSDCIYYYNGALCDGSGLSGDAYEISIQAP